jgi:hypothetical protein
MTEDAKSSQDSERTSSNKGDLAATRAKFDLGTAPQLDSASVPWGYGEDRIRALVRSPDSLYLYWEITDLAIDAARKRLGPAGERGWCNLRVYDTTGREFDGTNANHYFDIPVDRGARERFLMIHRPTSVVHVEIGIMSHEGYFQPIARSGRAEFPRKSPSPHAGVEWMTVTDGADSPTARPFVSRYTGPPPQLSSAIDRVTSDARDAPPGEGPTVTTAGAWTVNHGSAGEWFSVSVDPTFAEISDIASLLEHSLTDWRTEWRGGLRWLRWTGEGTETLVAGERFEWHSGPFPVELVSSERVDVRFSGMNPLRVPSEWGPVDVYGPWQVTMHGHTTEPTRRVLASWTMHWVRASPPVVERWITAFERRRIGAFARHVWFQGASDRTRLWELGASELWRLGASERVWMGASAWMLLGASEILGWGASQLAWAGASALLQRGASFGAFAGASERYAFGASERYALGASERYALGASERYALGSSERYALGSSAAWSGFFFGGSEHVAASAGKVA